MEQPSRGGETKYGSQQGVFTRDDIETAANCAKKSRQCEIDKRGSTHMNAIGYEIMAEQLAQSQYP